MSGVAYTGGEGVLVQSLQHIVFNSCVHNNNNTIVPHAGKWPCTPAGKQPTKHGKCPSNNTICMQISEYVFMLIERKVKNNDDFKFHAIFW